MKKVIVTGAKGQLGNEIQTIKDQLANAQFVFVDVDELDITDQQAVQNFFEREKPDFCINCAAYTAVDKAEEAHELCDAINVMGTRHLAQACKNHEVVLFHISTDFVFDGMDHQLLSEDHPARPVCYYGESKLNGEKVLQDIWSKHFIIRTSWLYSSHGNNFVKTMIRLSETKDELKIIADQIGTPTYARDLAALILQIIEKEVHAFGLYHYSNEGVASWYDFTKAIFEYKGIKTKVLPIPTSEYPTPAKRPHFSVMNKGKIKTTFGLEIPHWRESLQDCLRLL